MIQSSRQATLDAGRASLGALGASSTHCSVAECTKIAQTLVVAAAIFAVPQNQDVGFPCDRKSLALGDFLCEFSREDDLHCGKSF